MKYVWMLLIGFMCWPQQGVTHPHVWLDTSLELLVEQGNIIGIKVHWEFDALYSTSFLVEADTNNNKQLDVNETADTIKAVFTDGQQDLYQFMHIAPIGKKENFTLTNPKVWMENENLNYTFNIMLTTPQPVIGQHEFGIYDPEFYVAFEQDLNMILPAGVTCEQSLKENPNISIYYDLVNPETYTLTCT